MKVNFATFGDGNRGFKSAGKRLAKQAIASGLFNKVSNWDLHKIALSDPRFIIENREFIDLHPKGLGNFIWKPKILTEELRLMQDDDFLVMIDSGCQFNLTPTSKNRFHEYLSFARETGGTFMQLRNGEFGISDLSDAAWTKLQLLDLLDPKSEYRHTGQVQSGIIIVQKNVNVNDFAENWLHLCLLNEKSYLTSPAQNDVQLWQYQAHRWEQSIMSLLVKEQNFTLLQDETYFAPNWDSGSEFPIWAMRNRSGGDAYRRNFIDLMKILGARMSHYF